MKKTTLLLIVFATLTCYGQKNQDTSTAKTIPVYWMFKFTTSKLLNTPSNLKQNSIPIGAGVDFFYDWRLGESGFGLSPGIGFTAERYKTNTSLITNAGGVTEMQIIPDSIQYKSSSFTAMYFDVPIEFRYITKPNKNNRTFGFGVGIRASYFVYAFREFTAEQGDIKTTTTEKNLSNFSPFRYALTGRISYRRTEIRHNEVFGTSLSLITSYGLSPIFESGKGPTLTSYSIGIGYAFIFK